MARVWVARNLFVSRLGLPSNFTHLVRMTVRSLYYQPLNHTTGSIRPPTTSPRNPIAPRCTCSVMLFSIFRLRPSGSLPSPNHLLVTPILPINAEPSTQYPRHKC